MTNQVTRWTERDRPWHDVRWLAEMRRRGYSYDAMARVAKCSKPTIVAAMQRSGLAGHPVPELAPEPAPEPYVVYPDPVCDPRVCPYWDTCLDDVDAPCAMAMYGISVTPEQG